MAERKAEGVALNEPRVLIVKFSAIGDCVMAAWAVSDLRASLPSAQIDWAVQERCAPVIDPSHLASEVVLADRDDWRKRRWSPAVWRQQMAVYASLRKRQYDVGFDLQGHAKTGLCLRLSGAKLRLSRPGTDAFVRRLNRQVPEVDGDHEIERMRKLMAHWRSLEPMESPWMPNPGPSPFDRLTITIQTGAGGPGKAYPAAQFSEVARELVAQGRSVVAVGGPRDPRLEVEGVRNTAGEWTLAQTMSAVAHSVLHIASDTGTGHIAAAYGVPTVSIFGPMPAARYRPWGPDVTVLTHGPDPGQVPAQEVIAAAERALSRRIASVT